MLSFAIAFPFEVYDGPRRYNFGRAKWFSQRRVRNKRILCLSERSRRAQLACAWARARVVLVRLSRSSQGGYRRVMPLAASRAFERLYLVTRAPRGVRLPSDDPHKDFADIAFWRLEATVLVL
jgi:hypothetical protein